jgi:GMP synthase-like glutamine amidotransferase
MKPVLIVTHLPDRHSGLVGETFAESGYPVIECNPPDDAPLGPVDELGAVVSLGGMESATEVDRNPFLAQEVALLRAALEHEIPILGLCLGAQLLAVAAGGTVSTMDSLCLGWPALSVLPAARRDPLFAELAAGLPVLKWHQDRIDAPPDATLLASSPPGTALFRVGPVAWGSQMHLEATPSMLLDGWLTEAHGIAEIEAAGRPIADFRAECRARLPAQMAHARQVLTRFVGLTARRGEAAVRRAESTGGRT